MSYEPMRMCVVCRRRIPKQHLMRHVRLPESGKLFFDENQNQPGRGWYVCLEKGCQEKFRRFHPAVRKCEGDKVA